jgi:hypothetical protein
MTKLSRQPQLARALVPQRLSSSGTRYHQICATTAWLKRADQAAPKRNTITHAVARDQCVICGNASRFTHKGKPVDRSAQAVAAAAAAQEAVATGKIQSPRQVLIGQTLHRCANCSPGGNAITSVALPTAAALLPPES